MTTNHPFQKINEDSMHIDYEAAIDLPPLDGKERSIVVRLSFDKERKSAYSSLTYEVDGSHTDLQAVSEDGITRNLFNEITGAEIPKVTFNHRVSLPADICVDVISDRKLTPVEAVEKAYQDFADVGADIQGVDGGRVYVSSLDDCLTQGTLETIDMEEV